MFKRLYMLIKIGRKLATSGITNSIYKIYNPPIIIKIFFNILALGKKNNFNSNLDSDGKQLCKALQEMGTTFIKLGQFLATRPDIIGEELSKQLERLQDRLPPFSTDQANEILKKNLGNNLYKSIINISAPVAAASVAQVHKGQINDGGTIKDVAIKILRPDIKKNF